MNSLHIVRLTINNGLKYTVNLVQLLSQNTSGQKLCHRLMFCPPPAEMHAFRRLQNSLIALLIVDIPDLLRCKCWKFIQMHDNAQPQSPQAHRLIITLSVSVNTRPNIKKHAPNNTILYDSQ